MSYDAPHNGTGVALLCSHRKGHNNLHAKSCDCALTSPSRWSNTMAIFNSAVSRTFQDVRRLCYMIK